MESSFKKDDVLSWEMDNGKFRKVHATGKENVLNNGLVVRLVMYFTMQGPEKEFEWVPVMMLTKVS